MAAQLFALAVYFCVYALILGGVFYSLTQKTGTVLTVTVCAALAIGLCIVNIMTVIRSKSVYINRPDSIAIRDGREVVDLAYSTARPVLIYKITCSLVIVAVSVMVHIMFSVIMEDQILARLYGLSVICVATGVAVITAYPCIDRIACYRALRGETHDLAYDVKPDTVFKYILAVSVPVSICVWYSLRCYGSSPAIAWIVFPITALFVLAAGFLYNWVKDQKTS